MHNFRCGGGGGVCGMLDEVCGCHFVCGEFDDERLR